VMAMLCADDNGFGIVGVAPDSKVNAVSWHGWRPVTPLMINSLAASIDFAASHLRAGDILILEVHVPGPRHDFEIQKDPDGTPNQRGYIPVEWFPATAAAIKRATLRNIIVVSAAGNGYENLSDTIYDQRPRKFSFPSWWENPFRRRQRDTGSILVGAGAPPSDAYGPDRSRLEFSNYGSCVDCQGWGRQVVTAGYGALQGGPRERWYTGVFDGTSSATPLVAGAIACLQGAIKARGRQMQPPREIYLTPSRARELLRTTGSPQTSAPTSPATNRIGPRPNLKELLRAEGVS
jgi:subtilisin family serine protease